MKRSSLTPVIFCTVITLFVAYLGWRLDLSIWGWVALALPLATIFVFPLRHGLAFLNQLTFLSMGFLTYLFVFVLLRDLVLLVTMWSSAHEAIQSSPFMGSAMILCFTFLAFAFGTAWAAWGPRLRKVKIPLRHLPLDLQGFRILQISDLHVGPTIRRRYVQNVVRKINDCDADLVVMTGDIGDGVAADLLHEIEPLKNIKSRLGIYYIVGNHEYYWNVDTWLNVLRDLGAKPLLNEGQSIPVRAAKIWVGGVTDPAGEEPSVQKSLHGSSDENIRILLSHRPGIAEEAMAAGYQLQLSGHTHGGQFFPWTVAVRFAHKYFLGLHDVGTMWIYVNSGTGSWGPLLRLGTTPEITQLELVLSTETGIAARPRNP